MRGNALQAVLQKTMSHGLQYQVAYTNGKGMSNNRTLRSVVRFASILDGNVYDPKVEWAPCYYDSTNTLTAYAVYD